MTDTQRDALVALVALCPADGQEAGHSAVARELDLRPGAASLALRGLERRKLAAGHQEDAGRVWAPTLVGRAQARELARGRG
jgi:hypothetical protein